MSVRRKDLQSAPRFQGLNLDDQLYTVEGYDVLLKEVDALESKARMIATNPESEMLVAADIRASAAWLIENRFFYHARTLLRGAQDQRVAQNAYLDHEAQLSAYDAPDSAQFDAKRNNKQAHEEFDKILYSLADKYLRRKIFRSTYAFFMKEQLKIKTAETVSDCVSLMGLGKNSRLWLVIMNEGLQAPTVNNMYANKKIDLGEQVFFFFVELERMLVQGIPHGKKELINFLSDCPLSSLAYAYKTEKQKTLEIVSKLDASNILGTAKRLVVATFHYSLAKVQKDWNKYRNNALKGS